jgi:deoxyribodipyrimidine photo-lyase
MAAIWWIRRDLRLSDNQALHAALEHVAVHNDSSPTGGALLPVFVLDPSILEAPSASAIRSAFLFDGLRALDEALRARGSRLILRRGEPLQELAALANEVGAAALFAEEDSSPLSIARDQRVAEELSLTLLPGVATRPLDAVRGENGGYTVFTPYSKRWKSLPPLQRADLIATPASLPPVPESVGSLALDELPTADAEQAQRFPAGEAEAKRRLGAYVAGDGAPLFDYTNTRNRPDLDATSRLSPYLHLGMLSPRMAALGALNGMEQAPSPPARASAEQFLNELLWRDFFLQILRDHPHVSRGAFRPQYDRIEWVDDAGAFTAWCEGRTGYPFVDAAMRQLRSEGWMHNRLRMVVASFLVKDLLIDWRLGERYFMQQLIDGDVASNNGGWQWSAGTGTDAAPYFRIFNPVSQAQKFDPDGAFVRKWVPELAALPAAALQSPWLLSPAEQRHFGLRIGVDYPAPIIDHSFARERALAAYQAVK